MGNGSRDSASPKVELGEFYEYGLRLGELDEQLGESYEDCLVLDELFFKLDELYEQLSESVEVSPTYVCVCNHRVVRRKLDEWP